MYQHDAFDRSLIAARAEQFRDQVARYLSGALSEDEFKPLRLQNGIYIERHAPMLRIAIPYGVLDSRQLRALAQVARQHDRGVVHFTTRQNVQFNWIKLEETPDILARLAEVGLHAIQTSGSCIRNITTDAFAGVAADEIVDPRPHAELLRQWSTLHPEFFALARKFKVAINGAAEDRAATAVHDLAFDLYRDAAGAVVVRVKAGGGQGRTPRLAAVIREDLPWQHLLTYSEAVLRVYNRYGRRDNIYKARIKILVDALGAEAFAREVDAEFAHTSCGPALLDQATLDAIVARFRPVTIDSPDAPATAVTDLAAAASSDFRTWLHRNTAAHRAPGHAIVTLSLKVPGAAPGDASDTDLETIAALADRYSQGELRVSHHQNIVLPHVRRADLHALWQEAVAAGLAEANVGLSTDIIACPGGDFCALANAKSIPLAKAIQLRLAPRAQEVGPLRINISGCINACAHHHVGHIGILGVDKRDEEWFQILVGGRSDNAAALGSLAGKAVHRDAVPDAVSRIVGRYLALRAPGENFIDTVGRLGADPFKDAAHRVEEPA